MLEPVMRVCKDNPITVCEYSIEGVTRASLTADKFSRTLRPLIGEERIHGEADSWAIVGSPSVSQSHVNNCSTAPIVDLRKCV